MAGHGGNYTMVRRQGNCMMVRRQDMKSVVFVWVSCREIKEMAVSYETFVKKGAGAPAGHGPAGNSPFDRGETVFRGKTRTGSPGERRQRRGQRRALRRRAEAKAEAEEEEEEEDGTKLKKQNLQHG